MRFYFSFWMWNLKLWWCERFGKYYTANVCGHKFHRFTEVWALGFPLCFKLSKQADYCPECLAKTVIRCAHCFRLICAGDLITLRGKNLDLPVEVQKIGVALHKGSLVCCVRCAEFGRADALYKWIPPGKVYEPETGKEWLEMIG